MALYYCLVKLKNPILGIDNVHSSVYNGIIKEVGHRILFCVVPPVHSPRKPNIFREIILLRSDDPTNVVKPEYAHFFYVSQIISTEDLESGKVYPFSIIAHPYSRKRTNARIKVPIYKKNQQQKWLEERLKPAAIIVKNLHMRPTSMPSQAKKVNIFGTFYRGMLKIEDAQKLNEIIKTGIGPWKSHGLGLLLIGSSTVRILR